MSLPITILFIILLLPVFGIPFYYLVPTKRVPFLSSIVLFIAFAFSLYLHRYDVIAVDWYWLTDIKLSWRVDKVSMSLISLVTFISFLVHLFSVFYMEDEKGKTRYYSELGFFTTSMLGLLSADHLILLFVFWELVGVSSFLLIGYWYQNEEKSYSARYSFMVNRVADACLLGGILILLIYSGDATISTLTSDPDSKWMAIASFGIVLGAMGKSAQFPFLTWLPRAMAGPTPVSALIHAATMVAAGVYLLFRVYIVFPESVSLFTALIGVITSFLAGYAAFTQFDIKKVLAYSTVSQLGYMVMGIGVGAADMSVFHLWTHAFFKAGLFLSAGAVIHLLHQQNSEIDSQDMRIMGGLRRVMPITFWAYTVCMLALSGLPFFTGFLSKDGIILGTWEYAIQNIDSLGSWIILIPVLGFLTAFLTAFYMGRQLFLVFFGSFRGKIDLKGIVEPKLTLGVPLVLLSLGSLWVFYSFNPFGHHFWLLEYFNLAKSVTESGLSGVVALISTLLAFSGIGISYYLYKKESLLFNANIRIFQLSYNAWYLERLYDKTITSGFQWVSRFVHHIDKKVIDPVIDKAGIGTVVLSKLVDILDKLIVDGIVNFTAWIQAVVGQFLRRFTATRVQLQIFWLVIGVVFILIWLKF